MDSILFFVGNEACFLTARGCVGTATIIDFDK